MFKVRFWHPKTGDEMGLCETDHLAVDVRTTVDRDLLNGSHEAHSAATATYPSCHLSICFMSLHLLIYISKLQQYPFVQIDFRLKKSFEKKTWEMNRISVTSILVESIWGTDSCTRWCRDGAMPWVWPAKTQPGSGVRRNNPSNQSRRNCVTGALAVLQLHLFELAHPRKEKHLKVVLTSSIWPLSDQMCAKWIEIPKWIKMDHLRKLFAVCVDALPASDWGAPKLMDDACRIIIVKFSRDLSSMFFDVLMWFAVHPFEKPRFFFVMHKSDYIVTRCHKACLSPRDDPRGGRSDLRSSKITDFDRWWLLTISMQSWNHDISIRQFIQYHNIIPTLLQASCLTGV